MRLIVRRNSVGRSTGRSAADRAEIEALLETWKGWANVLAQVDDAPGGSIPAEAQAVARQILKKVLAGPIEVR